MSLRTFALGSLLDRHIIQSIYKKERKGETKDESEQSIIRRIQDRRRYRAPTICCRCFRKRKENAIRNRGIDRAYKELDVEYFIKKQMQVSIILRTIFTKAERFLVKNQRKFVLSKQDERELSSDSSFDGELMTKGPYFDQLLIGTQPKLEREVSER